MKKIIGLFFAIGITCMSWAQAPSKFTYQAVIRDTVGNLVKNRNITAIIQILKGSTEGEPIYYENHSNTTNSNGLLTLIIGENNNFESNLQEIDWSSGNFYLKVLVDAKGGSNYNISSVSQILSVPFALQANSAINSQFTDSAKFSLIADSARNVSNDYNALKNKPEIATSSVAGLMSAEDKAKLDSIEKGAQKNVNADWNASSGPAKIINKPKLAGVATSGNYQDLNNKPKAKSSVSPRIATRGQLLSVSFSGGDEISFSQSSSSCPNVYANVKLTMASSTISQSSATIDIYPYDSYFIDQSRFDVLFDIPYYVPSGMYDIILAPSTECPVILNGAFKVK